MFRSSLSLYVLAVSLLLIRPEFAYGQQNHPILDQPGLQEDRSYMSLAPFEHIDTLTGALVLRFTDLVLPGNAGRELRFERAYNSKTNSWTFGIAGIPLSITDFGPAYHGPDPQDGTPIVYTSDGGQR
jgi:hypothetical protein